MSDGVGSTDAPPLYSPERRRFSRLAASGISISAPMLVAAEVIDISLTGALVRCGCRLRVGERPQLRIVLGRQPFVTTMSVVRVVKDWSLDTGTTDVGVAFVDRDDHGTDVLRHFLTQFVTPSRL